MSSDYWRVPITDLQTIDAKLKALDESVSSVEKTAEGAEGVDDIHGAKITSAVSGFFSDWKASRESLLDNVGVLGEAAGMIASTTETFDTEVASNLNEMAGQLRPGDGA